MAPLVVEGWDKDRVLVYPAQLQQVEECPRDVRQKLGVVAKEVQGKPVWQVEHLPEREPEVLLKP